MTFKKAPILFILTLFLCLFSSSIVLAEDRFTIRDLVFQTDKGEEVAITSKDLFHKSGIELNSEKLMEDIETLKYDHPQYQSIEVFMDPIENSAEVNLRFTFQLRRLVGTLRIIAPEHLEMPENIHHKLSLHRGGHFKGSYLKRDQEQLRDLFIQQGHPEVIIKPLLKEDADESYLAHVELHIMVTKKAAKVYEIKFPGLNNLDSDIAEKAIKTKTRSWFLASRPKFDKSKLEKDARDLTNILKDHGFLEAQVDFKWTMTPDRLVTVKFHVSEGPRYKVKKVKIYGVKNMDIEDVKEAFKIHKNGYYSEIESRKALQRVREFYGKNGRPLTQTLIDYDSEQQVLSLYIKEGLVQKIENIKVEGLQNMKLETVLLDVDIKKGETVDTSKIEDNLKKLNRTGYYSKVNMDFVPTSLSAGDLVIVIEEAKNQMISFGMGMATSGLMGELSYNNSNLFFSGKKFSLSVAKTEELTKLGMMFVDPHLFGSDYELIARLQYKDEDLESFQDERIQTLIVIEKAINKNLRVGMGVRLEFVNIDDLSEELNDLPVAANKKDRILGLVSTLAYRAETLDSAGSVKEGVRVKLGLLPSMANDDFFVKSFMDGRGSFSLGENSHGSSHTITGRVTLGQASKKTPFHERHYAGGIGTLRGYEDKSIGASEGGGQYLVSMGINYAFPIYKDRIKGVTFIEGAAVGNNWDQLSDFRVVGGVGLRANLRDTFLQNSIEAGFAVPLRKMDGDSLKPFYLILGDYDPAYDL